MKRTILFLLGIMMITSCLRQNQIKQEKRWLENYNKALLTFSPSQISHFPNTLSQFSYRKLYVYHEGSTKYHNKAGLVLNSYSDSSFYQELRRSLHLNNIQEYPLMGENLIFIGDTLKDYSNYDDGIPVPSFAGVDNKFGISNIKLNERGVVYIIESNHGEFLDSVNLVRTLSLPNSWNHGFSRGIVLDSVEYNIVYWLVIW